MSVRVTKWKDGKVMVDVRARTPGGEKVRDRRVLDLSPAAAKRWAEAREREIYAGNLKGEPKQASRKTLAEFWPEYEKTHMATLEGSTNVGKRKTWRCHIDRLLGRKRLDEIGTKAIDGLVSDMKAKGLSAKTVNNVLADLSSLLNKAVEWKELEEIPTINFLRQQKPEIAFYEAEDLERLLVAARRIDADNELVVLLGADAGLRASEMVALSWGDVDLVRGTVRIEKAEPIRDQVKGTKSRKVRRVPLTDRLRAALKEYKHLRGERVFYRDEGRTIDLFWLRDKLEAAQKLAGMEKTTGALHVLRHTFGTLLVSRGVSLLQVQDWMGHERIETTMRYLHLVKTGAADAIKVLEDAPSGATVGQRQKQRA